MNFVKLTLVSNKKKVWINLVLVESIADYDFQGKKGSVLHLGVRRPDYFVQETPAAIVKKAGGGHGKDEG